MRRWRTKPSRETGMLASPVKVQHHSAPGQAGAGRQSLHQALKDEDFPGSQGK